MRGEPKEGPQEADPRGKRGFLPAQPWRRCPLACLRPSSSGSVGDEPSSHPPPPAPPRAVDLHTCAACPPPHAPHAPAAPPRPAPLPWDPPPRILRSLPAHCPFPILSRAVTPSLSFCAAPSTPAWSSSFPGQESPSLASPSSPLQPALRPPPHSPPPAAPPFWPLPHNTSQVNLRPSSSTL